MSVSIGECSRCVGCAVATVNGRSTAATRGHTFGGFCTRTLRRVKRVRPWAASTDGPDAGASRRCGDARCHPEHGTPALFASIDDASDISLTRRSRLERSFMRQFARDKCTVTPSANWPRLHGRRSVSVDRTPLQNASLACSESERQMHDGPIFRAALRLPASSSRRMSSPARPPGRHATFLTPLRRPGAQLRVLRVR